MSNIYTSFIRIQRRDRQEMSEAEMDSLFEKAVRVHDQFGSYWVRIVRKYRKTERCFDIQFGSGKRWSEFATETDFALYDIWERINYEGGCDFLFTLQKWKSEHFEGIEHTEVEVCQYGFDKIVVTSDSDENWLAEFGSEAISSWQHELRIRGTYYACNSRSFVDVYEDSAFYGPRLPYTEDYPYDFFVLVDSEVVVFHQPLFLSRLSQSQFKEMPNNTKLEFFWKHRKVVVIRKNYDQVEFQTADYWDNCINEKYLKRDWFSTLSP